MPAADVLVFTSEQAVTRTGLRGWLTRHQAWLFFPLTLREGLALKLHGFQDLRRQTGRDRLLEDTLLVAHVAGYVTLFLTTMPLAHALVFAALHQALFGLHLGTAFAPNHKGIDMPDPDSERWGHLRLQVLTSRNVRDSLLTDWFLGGLNYPIEHHLFPKHAPPAPEARPVHGEGPLPRPRHPLRGDRPRRLPPSGPAAHVRSGRTAACRHMRSRRLAPLRTPSRHT